jgi:molecular chaperone GrpE
MLSPTQEALLAQFRTYLEESAAGHAPPEEEADPIDLYTLLSELAALKNEVRIESRQVKGALDQFRGLVEPLQNGQAALQSEILHLRDAHRHAARDALRPVLLELLEIRDRIAAGLETKTDQQLSSKLFKPLCRQEQALLAAWRAGQEMTLRRLDQLLASQSVLPMEVLAQPLDPRLARAVRVESHKNIAHGVVVSELRKGFLWHGAVLRPAEVVINRCEES